MSKAKRKEKEAAEVFGWRGTIITPDNYEGGGMEDLDAALENQPEADEDEPEPPDLSDPDAKAAWLELLVDAMIRQDDQTIKALVDLAESSDPLSVERVEGEAFDSFAEQVGFTGEKKDRRGRRYCYQNGVRVPCPKADAGSVERPKTEGKPAQTDSPDLDYQHKDESHPIAKAITADTETKKVVAEFVKTFAAPDDSEWQKIVSETTEALDRSTEALERFDQFAVRWNAAARTGRITPDLQAERVKAESEADEWEAKAKEAMAKRDEYHAKQAERLKGARKFLAERLGPKTPSRIEASLLTEAGGGPNGWQPLKPTPAASELFEDALTFVESITHGVKGQVAVVGALETGDLANRACFFHADFVGPTRIALFAPHVRTATAGGSIARGIAEDTAHEIGHFIEESKPGLIEAANAFRAYRVGDEQPTQLKKAFPGQTYSSYEMGFKDQFDKVFSGVNAYYAGKSYGAHDKAATEIVSMGLEQLYRDPVAFAQKDPEYFHWLITNLRKE